MFSEYERLFAGSGDRPDPGEIFSAGFIYIHPLKIKEMRVICGPGLTRIDIKCTAVEWSHSHCILLVVVSV